MHFLLYVVDSLRADHLSCYGYDRETTPNLDDLADDGVRFNSCISPSTWTAPVAASLVSGWYPPAHGQERRGDVLPSSLPMIQEKFQAAGFETVLVTGMGHVSAATGYDRGFDEIVETYKQDSIIDKRTRSTTEQEQLYLEDAEIIAYPRAEDLNDQLMQWLAERESEDTFALVWAIDPHDPYDPPADAERFLSDAGRFGDLGRTRESAGNANTSQEFEHVKDLYDCEIRYWDQEFGSLIERIKQRGLYDDTTVAVLGDHGEAFGEQTWVDFPGYSRPLRSHGNPPFGNQVHVPLILK
ncbi:MAG: sulfatase, partial [Halobacteriaceae archaeon]